MMRTNVKVLYFASARELASTRSESLVLPEGESLAGLIKAIVKLHPPMKRLGDSTKFSVNLTVSDADVVLRDGDEVGVLPPVAGG